MQESVVPMIARNTVNAWTSMKILPLPGPKMALPTMIIMSPIGAADPRRSHAVAAIQEVVRREILDQVTERPLHQQRGDHRDGDVALGVLRLAAHGRDRFESDQNQNRDAWPARRPSRNCATPVTDPARGMGLEDALVVLLGIVDLERNRLAGCVQLGLRRAVFLAHDRCRRACRPDPAPSPS